MQAHSEQCARFVEQMRAYSCYWMGSPERWFWRTPDGVPQALVTIPVERDVMADESHYWPVGRTNLLWLAMDMDRPPLQYNARNNGLFVQLLTIGNAVKLNSRPLYECASVLTLKQFRSLCLTARFTGPMLPTLPHDLVRLTDKHLAYATR